MKKMFVVAMTVIAAFAFQSAFAQAPAKTDAEKAAAKAKQEQIMQTRLQLLKDELKLDDAQFANFEPVYRDYRRALQKVVDNKAARVKKAELTNENALEVVLARLSNTIRTSTVKQTFLLKFSKVIEPVQIEKLYRVDDRIAKEARKIVQYRADAK